MNQEELYRQLQEKQWRRPPNVEEAQEVRAFLAADPRHGQDWEEEVNLTRLLNGLSDVELSSNFTARTVQAAELKLAADRRRNSRWRQWWERRWRLLPRLAFAAFLLTASLVIYRETQSNRREQLVEGISTIAQVAAIPGPETLQDFDAIRALSPAPGADVELLRLLQ
jgi:hypothetical protein